MENKITLDELCSYLDKLQLNYEDSIKKVYVFLKNKVRFSFAVQHLPGDGFVILNEDNARVARLGACISIIRQFGFLSNDKFNEVYI